MGLKNGYWVTSTLAAGEYPGHEYELEADIRVQKLLDNGITAFLDLTEELELEPYDHLLPQGIEYRRFPIRDMSITTSKHMDQILQQIQKWHSEGYVVYVHCWGGIGRTGTVVGCFLKSNGEVNPLDKVQELYQNGMSTQKIMRHPRSPQTPQQLNFVRHWGEKIYEEGFGEKGFSFNEIFRRRMVSIRGKWSS